MEHSVETPTELDDNTQQRVESLLWRSRQKPRMQYALDTIDYLCPDSDNTDKYPSLRQDILLSERIQKGLAAENELEREDSKIPHDQLVREMIDGQQARNLLFESHLPFALTMARASVGIIAETTRAKHNHSRLKLGIRAMNGAYGTYKPIHSLKSPHADLESRISNATIGLWVATAMYNTSKSTSENRNTAKFTTFSAWYIQQYIERGMRVDEAKGAQLSSAATIAVNSYFNTHRSVDSKPIPKEIEQLIDVSSAVSIEDMPDIADIYGVESDQGYESDITRRFLIKDIEDTFDDLLAAKKLQGRDVLLISMRYGLFDGEPKTLDEVGQALGVTRERVRQIESRALAVLRSQSAMAWRKPEELRPLIFRSSTDSELNDNYSSAPLTAYGRHGDGSLRTGRTLANRHAPVEALSAIPEHAITVEEIHRSEELESWQAFVGEKWDDPVRIMPNKAVDSYTFEQIKHIIKNAQEYNFQESFGKNVGSEFPAGLYQRIKGLRKETYLSSDQIAELRDGFDSEVMPRLQEKILGDISIERIDKLFQALHLR